jgi:Multicopper oxidase
VLFPPLESLQLTPIGQRFDAIVTANGTVGNYYLRAIPGACVMNMNDGKGSQSAIVSYARAGSSLPTSQAAPVGDDCKDEPLEKTILFVAKAVDASNFDPYHLPIASPYQVTSNEEGRVFRWQIGKTTQVVNWENPILERLVQGNTTITPEDNIIGVDEQNTWAYWYIQNNFLRTTSVSMSTPMSEILR